MYKQVKLKNKIIKESENCAGKDNLSKYLLSYI